MFEFQLLLLKKKQQNENNYLLLHNNFSQTKMKYRVALFELRL